MLEAITRFKGAITECRREEREVCYRTKGLVEPGLCLSLPQQVLKSKKCILCHQAEIRMQNVFKVCNKIQLLTAVSICQLHYKEKGKNK